METSESLTLADAMEVIRVSIALGADIPVFPLSTVYSVWVGPAEPSDYDDKGFVIGNYRSRLSARIALRNYALEQWYENGESPLLAEEEVVADDNDHSRFSDGDIIDAFFGDGGKMIFEINALVVDPDPKREDRP